MPIATLVGIGGGIGGFVFGGGATETYSDEEIRTLGPGSKQFLL